MKRYGLGILGLTTVSAFVFACEFRVGTDKAKTPANTSNTTTTTTAAPAPTPVPTPQPNQSRLARLAASMNRRTLAGSGTPSSPGTTPTPATTPTTTPTTPPTVPTTPGSVTPPPAPADPFMQGANSFGNGTPADGTFKGSVFFLTAAPQKVPALDNLTPNTILFTKELNVANKEFTEGFPGADPKRVENFAIRYEAPLNVSKEATYTFRIVADDGAILSIDDTVIVNNDGIHAATEKTGAAHLIPGLHYMRLDYVQGTSKTVALQAFVKPEGGTERLLGPQL